MTTILTIGTFDTKSAEIGYIGDMIRRQGARPLTMDVSILGDTDYPVDIDKHKVAAAAGKSIKEMSAVGDENTAMTWMAQGATKLTRQLYAEKQFDGLLALGGSMGTDLALDVANAVPVGVPKYIISTIAFSPLLPPERLPADIQMILWSGGLYGLNTICRSLLSQAVGAIVGGCRAAESISRERPLIGMTSLGKSCLSYMVGIKPNLEERGYEVAIFHATGMGGRAFESLAADRLFAAVLDFCPQEVGNYLHGSAVHAGADRLENAGKHGIPQIIAPGCADLVDLPTWANKPKKFAERTCHAHNRLISSVVLTPEERRESAQMIVRKLEKAKAPVHVILPMQGVEEWDRPDQPLHDSVGLRAFMEEMQKCIRPPMECTVLDAHINDPSFVATALRVFDDWRERGIIGDGVFGA